MHLTRRRFLGLFGAIAPVALWHGGTEVATSYPAALDALANPIGTTTQDTPGFLHADQHTNANDAIEAIEAKVGTGASTATANTVLRGTGAGTTAYGQIVAGDITAGAVMRPIHDSVLGGPAGSFDVTGISAAYRALQIQLVARGDTAAAATTCLLRFNNDSTAIYDYENTQANNATLAGAGSVAGTSISLGGVPAASTTAGIFGQFDISIGAYTDTTAHKIVRSHSGYKVSTGVPAAGDLVVQSLIGWWRNTAAITRVTILPAAGNFATGTRLTIWGLPV